MCTRLSWTPSCTTMPAWLSEPSMAGVWVAFCFVGGVVALVVLWSMRL